MHFVRHQNAQRARRHDNPASAVAVSARRAEAQAQLILLMGVAWYRARRPWRIAVPLEDDVVVDASPDVLGVAVRRRPAPAAIGHDRMLRGFPDSPRGQPRAHNSFRRPAPAGYWGLRADPRRLSSDRTRGSGTADRHHRVAPGRYADAPHRPWSGTARCWHS